MAFAGLNLVAIVGAAVASFLFGAVWYGLLSNRWTAALGKSREEIGASISVPALPFVVSFISLLVMAWVLAGLMGHLGTGQVTMRGGIISGAFVWLGFVVTVIATNHRFAGARWSLTLIDAGHWLGVLLIQGAIIGLLGV